MTLYAEIITAAQETASKLLTMRRPAGSRTDIHGVIVNAGGGPTACVDWDPTNGCAEISLPTMLPSASLTRAEADRIVGYLAHECCHVLHTDKPEWLLAVKAGKRVQAWTNALEDVRIERVEIATNVFPNLRNVLSALMNTVVGEAGVTLHRMGLPPMGNDRADAPFYACILGRLANGYAIPAASGLHAAISPSIRPVVDAALAGLPACRDTRAIRELAERLVAMEQQQAGQGGEPQAGQGGKPQAGQGGEPQAGQGGQGGQGGEPQAGQGGEGGQGGEPQAGQGGEPQAGQGGQGGQGGEPAPAGKGKGGKGRGAKGSGTGGELGAGLDPSPSLAPVAQAVAKRTPDKVPAPSTNPYENNHNAGMIKRAGDAATDPVTQDNSTATFPADRLAHAGFAQSLPRASVLQGEIARMLVSEEVRQRTHHEHHGRLDRRALTRMRAGATDVFSRRRDRPGVETAVLINVDLSASMADAGRMPMARNTAWQLANAAELAGARVAIVGFEARRGRETVLHVAKGWSDPLQQVGRRVAYLAARGGTHLAPAIMGGARMLTETGASRLVQIVITDGMCSYGAIAVRECCAIARDTLDTETVAIGIDAPDVVDVFPGQCSVNITRLSDLTHGALRSLATMLEDGAGE